MNKGKKDDMPIIINGELNMNKPPREQKQVSLPKKTFTFTDLVLCLIGCVLIIYGIYTLINKDNKDKTIQDEVVKEDTKESDIDFKFDDIEKYITLTKEESINLYSSIDLKNMNNGLTVDKLSNNAKLALAAKITTPYIINNDSYILEEELDKNINALFGNINYVKESFSYGNNKYIYNQETKRYYLLDDATKLNVNYQKFDYTTKEEIESTLVIREYIAYTDVNNQKSWTLNNIPLLEVIDSNNIKEKYNILKCIEYVFSKANGKYNLQKIAIK